MWPYGGDGNGFGRPAGLGGPCSLIVAATRRDAGASGRDHRLWAYSGQWYGHGPPEGLGDGRRSAAVRRGMKGLGGPGAGWAFLSLLTAWSRQVLPLKADERASRPCAFDRPCWSCGINPPPAPPTIPQSAARFRSERRIPEPALSTARRIPPSFTISVSISRPAFTRPCPPANPQRRHLQDAVYVIHMASIVHADVNAVPM